MIEQSAEPKSHGTMPVGLPLRALPLFVFLHVPKTAGTSVRHVLRRMFREFYWQLGSSAQSGRSLGGEPEWKQAGFFDNFLGIGIGHNSIRHPIVNAARHTGRRLVFIGAAREPAARAASFYDYIRRQPEHPMYAEVFYRSLLDAVESVDRFRKATVNAQLRQLFGSEDPGKVDDIIKKENFIVGRQENLTAFLDAVSAVSGLPRVQSLAHINAADNIGTVVIERAREQADYADALSRLAELNFAEAAFLRSHAPVVLVTTATRARQRAS